MSTTTIQGQILAALANDPRFPQDSEQYKLLAPYLPDALLSACGDRLDDEFSLQAYIEIGWAFLRNLLSSGYLDSLPTIEAIFVSSEYYIVIDRRERIASDLLGFLAELGMTEEQCVAAIQPGFNDKVLAAYRAGTLNFLQLVTSQPGVFVPEEA